ncbi:MAG: NAD(P)-dependent oxidoreductase [Ignavibacteriae bacterium]|nr:NAD(P)-dependent oxidoreductase [Ignavibacteriota bacterium]
MKRVLITGGTGFVGRHCIPFLKQRGFEVFALSSKPHLASPGITWMQCDLLSTPSLTKCMTLVAPTHLLHLAWNVIPGKFWTSPDNLKWLKVSIDLVEAFAEQGGKRIVAAGTCAEYDWNATEFSEAATICRPHSLYGACKSALHMILESLAMQKGFSQAWGRIFYLYGPHEYPERFIPSIIQGILEKKRVPCTHGNQIRDFLYVEDVASAFAALLESDVQGAVNIGSGEGIAVKDVVKIIGAYLEGTEFVNLGAIPLPLHEPSQMIANTSRLNGELHWKPKFCLENGLHHTVEWWKKECRRR